MATPDPVFLYCICSESDVQPHVHCQCGICDNKPVSRATAYRHFNRTNSYSLKLLVMAFAMMIHQKVVVRSKMIIMV